MKYWIAAFGVLATLVVIGRKLAGKATGLDRAQAGELLGAIRSAYASTLLAFDASGDEAIDFNQRDARAAADAQNLERAFAAAKPALSAKFAPAVAAFVDAVSAAQVQLMAFAINRKNRGLPDAAQTELENNGRRAFKRETQPVYEQLIGALS
jgi:hypothetical protein